MYDAEPSDIYVDRDGKLWRVLGVCHEPSVIMQEIEPQNGAPPAHMSGGVSGYMWDGFKRIHRPCQHEWLDFKCTKCGDRSFPANSRVD